MHLADPDPQNIEEGPEATASSDVEGTTTTRLAPLTPEGQPFVGPFTRRQLGWSVAAIAVVALLLLVVTRPLASTTSAPAATNVPGASFYVLGAQTQGLKIGDVAPEFAAADGTTRLTDLSGQPVTLASLRGRPVWLVFWATWCPPCQTETPDIQRTWEQYKSQGLAVVAVDVQEPRDAVADYVRTYSLTYPVALDTTASVMKTYAVFGLPTHYFIDRDGVVRDRYFGPLTGAQMRARVGGIVGRGP